MKKKILIASLAAILLAGGGFGSWYLLNGTDKKESISTVDASSDNEDEAKKAEATTEKPETTEAAKADAKSDQKTEDATTEADKKDADWWISMGVQVDDDKKTETTTEKPSTTEETTTEAKKPSNTESKKPATTENTTEAPTQTHTHTWATRTVTDQDAWDEQVCTKEAWDEKVCTKEAWDEQVPRYETTYHSDYYCMNCHSLWAKDATSCPSGYCPVCGGLECYSDIYSKQEIVGYDTVHHDAEYKTVHHDAEYTTKHHDAVTHTETYCTGCGATN